MKKEIISWRTIVEILKQTGYYDLYAQEVENVANCLRKVKKQKEVIDKLIELNQMINNSDYVYSQDEITAKNLDILKEVSE